MNAAGYALFSGVAGIGDLGTGADGALHGVQPEWLWRSALVLVGAASYWLVVRISLRLIAPRLEGSGAVRVRKGSRIALIAGGHRAGAQFFTQRRLDRDRLCSHVGLRHCARTAMNPTHGNVPAQSVPPEPEKPFNVGIVVRHRSAPDESVDLIGMPVQARARAARYGKIRGHP